MGFCWRWEFSPTHLCVVLVSEREERMNCGYLRDQKRKWEEYLVNIIVSLVCQWQLNVSSTGTKENKVESC